MSTVLLYDAGMETFSTRYGPWAVVAGASEGLGAAFAESLAKRSVNVVLVARRKMPLEELAARLVNRYHIQVSTVVLDLGDSDRLQEFVDTLDLSVGMLVYNAAYAPVGQFAERPVDDLRRVIDVNVTAPLLLSRLLAPGMLARGRGGIVLMSSLAGTQGSPGIATYAASKSFNAILAEGLWQELRLGGIDVIASRAGAIRTPGYLAQGIKEAPGTLDAADVAEQTLKALGHGPGVVPGRINKLAHFVLSRLVPRKVAVAVMASNTRDLT
ncbi:MAG: SDR family NAD(P)-dependent oxidoreductase [Pseudomonadales bacterium]|nr:SDR family NAD(P)-dependent oxidoreductase [Pseudomonadales bacterium]